MSTLVRNQYCGSWETIFRLWTQNYQVKVWIGRDWNVWLYLCSSSTWEEVLLSSPSYIFLIPISPEFYSNVDNLKDIVSDESELQMLISKVFKLPFDSANESESEEEEEKRENRYREFYAAVHRRYILTEDGMNDIVRLQSRLATS